MRRLRIQFISIQLTIDSEFETTNFIPEFDIQSKPSFISVIMESFWNHKFFA